MAHVELIAALPGVPCMLFSELSGTLGRDTSIKRLVDLIQVLVMQSPRAGDVGHIRRDAPRVFAIYRLSSGSGK